MAKQRLTLVINGVNFSAAANRLAYTISYPIRQGENAVMMMNGDNYKDIIDRRPVITWPLNALWASEMAALESAIGSGAAVPCTYTDRRTGATASRSFYCEIGESEVGLIDTRGYMWRDGAVLTMEAL